MDQQKIMLAHGGGGGLTGEFISNMILSRFGNPILNKLDDSAVIPPSGGRLAFTSDSFVVSPAVFPGGNIGDLAVCGTVNDLSMSGAIPQYLSLALIIEEGVDFSLLETVLDSIKLQTDRAGVKIVTGDTKVVGKGQGDSIYINTAGIGYIPEHADISAANAKPGDAVIISGVPGLHGLAVMLSRNDFKFESGIESDVAPLGGIVVALIEAGLDIHVMRDLTRGGLATAMNDIAEKSGTSIMLEEEAIPSCDAQVAACELLGLDSLHIASEGRFALVLPAEQAENAIYIMKQFADAKDAAVIGSVRKKDRYPLEVTTSIGTSRVVTIPRGEQMPRIC